MDREKVIGILDELRNFADNDVHPVVSPENWHVYSELRDLIDEAEASIITLLKEQEAIKPIYNEEKYGDHLPHCGSCKKVLPNNAVYGEINFCYYCGQAVKWE